MQNRGKSIRSHWSADSVLKPDEKRRNPGDAAFHSPFMFFSPHAYLQVQDIIEPYGESLRVPLVKSNEVVEGWVAYNPLQLFSIVNDPRVLIRYIYPDEKKKPTRVTRFYFDEIEEKLNDVPVFVLEEDYSVFVTDRFVERVRERNLRGLGFRRLWDSKLGSVHSEILLESWGLPESEDYNW